MHSMSSFPHTFDVIQKNKKNTSVLTPVNGEWILHVGGCLTSSVTSLTSDMIFLYQLAQARPHNVLHFLVLEAVPGN